MQYHKNKKDASKVKIQKLNTNEQIDSKLIPAWANTNHMTEALFGMFRKKFLEWKQPKIKNWQDLERFLKSLSIDNQRLVTGVKDNDELKRLNKLKMKQDVYQDFYDEYIIKEENLETIEMLLHKVITLCSTSAIYARVKFIFVHYSTGKCEYAIDFPPIYNFQGKTQSEISFYIALNSDKSCYLFAKSNFVKELEIPEFNKQGKLANNVVSNAKAIQSQQPISYKTIFLITILFYVLYYYFFCYRLKTYKKDSHNFFLFFK